MCKWRADVSHNIASVPITSLHVADIAVSLNLCSKSCMRGRELGNNSLGPNKAHWLSRRSVGLQRARWRRPPPRTRTTLQRRRRRRSKKREPARAAPALPHSLSPCPTPTEVGIKLKDLGSEQLSRLDSTLGPSFTTILWYARDVVWQTPN